MPHHMYTESFLVGLRKQKAHITRELGELYTKTIGQNVYIMLELEDPWKSPS